MIYAEWTLYGEFENGIFPTWDAYHAAVRGLSHRRTRPNEKSMDNPTGAIFCPVS